MRILQSDLPAFVTNCILNVRQAVLNARAQGVIAELPGKIDFTVEVVQNVQSLQTVTDTSTSGSKGTTTTRPNVVQTTLKHGGGQQTQETTAETENRTSQDGKSDTTTGTNVEVTSVSGSTTDSETRTSNISKTDSGTGTNTESSSNSQASTDSQTESGTQNHTKTSTQTSNDNGTQNSTHASSETALHVTTKNYA